MVCASPKLLAQHGTPASPEELSLLPCVSFDPLSPAAIWLFRGPGTARVPITIRPRLSVSTAEAAVWAAIQAVGVTRVLHYQCAEAVSDGSLRLILPDYELAPLPVHLVHAARGVLPLKMRVFLDFAGARMRDMLKSL